MRFRSTVKQFDNQQSPDSLRAKLSKGEKCALWNSPLICLVLQHKYHSLLRVQRPLVAGKPISRKRPLSFEISFLALRLRTLNLSQTDLGSSLLRFRRMCSRRPSDLLSCTFRSACGVLLLREITRDEENAVKVEMSCDEVREAMQSEKKGHGED